jgi:Cft2 family RNA processing exonuclease
MSEIRILPLGAGQDVGRSCILITMGGKNIMLDCGLHMGFHDDVYHLFVFFLLIFITFYFLASFS